MLEEKNNQTIREETYLTTTRSAYDAGDITPVGILTTETTNQEENLIPDLALDIDVIDNVFPATTDGFELVPEFSNVIEAMLEEKNNQTIREETYLTTTSSPFNMMEIISLSGLTAKPTSHEENLIPNLALDIDIIDNVFPTMTDEFKSGPGFSNVVQTMLEDVTTEQNKLTVQNTTSITTTIIVFETTTLTYNESLIPDFSIDVGIYENVESAKEEIQNVSTEKNMNLTEEHQEFTPTLRDRRETTPNFVELEPELSITVNPPGLFLNISTGELKPPGTIVNSIPNSTTLRTTTSTEKTMLQEEKISLFDALIPVLFLPDAFFDTTIQTTIENIDSTFSLQTNEEITTVTESTNVFDSTESNEKLDKINEKEPSMKTSRSLDVDFAIIEAGTNLSGESSTSINPSSIPFDELKTDLNFSELLLAVIEEQNSKNNNRKNSENLIQQGFPIIFTTQTLPTLASNASFSFFAQVLDYINTNPVSGETIKTTRSMIEENSFTKLPKLAVTLPTPREDSTLSTVLNKTFPDQPQLLQPQPIFSPTTSLVTETQSSQPPSLSTTERQFSLSNFLLNRFRNLGYLRRWYKFRKFKVGFLINLLGLFLFFIFICSCFLFFYFYFFYLYEKNQIKKLSVDFFSF